MPKPASRVVKLPDGCEVIPEHFHEGPAAAQRLDSLVRGVIAVPSAEIEKRHAAWVKQRTKVKRRKRS